MNTIKGTVIQSRWENEEEISIEFQIEDGFLCTLNFDEGNSYKIMSFFDDSPAKKDAEILIGHDFTLLEHPAGGSLSPIALKISPKGDWIYKKKGDWCRWM